MTCDLNLDVFSMLPSVESDDRRFAFLHWVLQGEFPSFDSTIKALRLPATHLAALRFLRLAIPRLHSLCSLLDRRVHRQGLELVSRYLHPDVAEEATGSPKFLGNLNNPFAHVPNRRRQDCLHQTIAVQQRGPWSSQGKGSHDWVFRRSIAWLSDSLSTLRRAGYPDTTQDSLPVAGQALLDGILTRKVPMKGFKVVIYILFPFPKLCLAQAGWPWVIAHPGLPQIRTCAH